MTLTADQVAVQEELHRLLQARADNQAAFEATMMSDLPIIWIDEDGEGECPSCGERGEQVGVRFTTEVDTIFYPGEPGDDGWIEPEFSDYGDTDYMAHWRTLCCNTIVRPKRKEKE